MHISFVILHYFTIEDTLNCVDSIIKNVKYSNYTIIIVDNNSPNNTGIQLKDRFADSNNIKVILNKENLGFAKGNNVGYLYAKNSLKSDFIVLLNNDTIIKQNDFCINLLNKYNEKKFHVLGPDIISLKDNRHQNPVPTAFNKIEDVENKIKRLKILLMLSYIKLDTLFLKINDAFKCEEEEKKSADFDISDTQLHGSCIIFSPLYVANYQGLYEGTFMYIEECILRFIAKRDNLIMLYSPELIIYHKEGSASKTVYKNSVKKRRFYYNYSIESCSKLRELMIKSGMKK